MTTKPGRRAADRRRERQGADDDVDDDGRGTTEGDAPDPEGGTRSEPNDDDLPLVSQVREIEPSSVVGGAPSSSPEPGPASTKPGRGPRRGGNTQLDNDPELSFVNAVRAQSQSAEGRKNAPAMGEVTAVRAAPDRPKKRGARLIVLAGPDQGGEADIDVIPTLIGRTASAEIGLTDKAVSLRHVEILRAPDSDAFSLVELGSTSGTLVNGAIVDGETALVHGDVIALGATELRFVRGDKLPLPRPEPVAPAPPQPEPTEKLPTRLTKRPSSGQTHALAVSPQLSPPRDPAIMRARIRTIAPRVIGASVLILVLVVAGKLVHDRFFTDSAPAQIRAQVAELLADGRNRLRAQDVDGARAAADTVLALDSKNDEAVSLQKMADSEALARDAIALALRLGDEERDQEALQILKRVADASVFAPTRDRLKRTLDERDRLRSRRNVEALFDQGRIKEALAAGEKHVAAWPDDDEGKAILEKIKAAQAMVPKDPGLAAARAAFASGDIEGAKRIARDNGLKSYAKDVDDFQSSLAKGKAALKHFDDDAADSLDIAFRLLSVLGGDPSSAAFADVRRPYGKALLVAGTADMEKNPCAGARKLYKAARVIPDDSAVSSQLRELESRAVATLDRARAAKHTDADRAAAIAREGMCMAKTGSRTYDELRALSRL